MAGGAHAPAEQRVRLYETLLQTTPDLVYMWDLQHRFTYANAALLAMWGKTWDEAIGSNCLELGHELNQTAVLLAVDEFTDTCVILQQLILQGGGAMKSLQALKQ